MALLVSTTEKPSKVGVTDYYFLKEKPPEGGFLFIVWAMPYILFLLYYFFAPALTKAYIFSAASRTFSSPGNSGILTMLTI